VRKEIAYALEKKIHVIPVLVQDAPLPSEKDLPVELRPLLERHAFIINELHADADINRLISSLKEKLPLRSFSWKSLTLALLSIMILGAVTIVLKVQFTRRQKEQDEVKNNITRSLHPFFPVKVEVGFVINLRHAQFAAYCSRIVSAMKKHYNETDESGIQLLPGNPLLPDSVLEPFAFSMFNTIPHAQVFWISDTANKMKTNSNYFNPDLSFQLGYTFNIDEKLEYKMRREIRIDTNGNAYMSYPTSVINLSDSYSNGRIVSTADLPGIQLVLEISPFFDVVGEYYDQASLKVMMNSISVDYLDIEFPGRREIRLNQKDFKLVETQELSGTKYFIYMFPGTIDKIEKMYIP